MGILHRKDSTIQWINFFLLDIIIIFRANDHVLVADYFFQQYQDQVCYTFTLLINTSILRVFYRDIACILVVYP